MTRQQPHGCPSRHDYEITVKGPAGARFEDAFAEFALTRKPVETVLCGAELDQAALYGILERIQALGLDLLEVRRRR